jgi:hypothetical protein
MEDLEGFCYFLAKSKVVDSGKTEILDPRIREDDRNSKHWTASSLAVTETREPPKISSEYSEEIFFTISTYYSLFYYSFYAVVTEIL